MLETKSSVLLHLCGECATNEKKTYNYSLFQPKTISKRSCI